MGLLKLSQADLTVFIEVSLLHLVGSRTTRGSSHSGANQAKAKARRKDEAFHA